VKTIHHAMTCIAAVQRCRVRNVECLHQATQCIHGDNAVPRAYSMLQSAQQKYIAAGHVVTQAAAVLGEAFAQPLMMHKQSFAVLNKHMVIG